MLDGVNHLTVRVALPGLNEKDINVTLEGNVFTIRGERHLPEGTDISKFSLMECLYGSFLRTVMLPDTVDPNAVNAVYTNGILEITVGKRAEAKLKQIPVTAAQSHSSRRRLSTRRCSASPCTREALVSSSFSRKPSASFRNQRAS